MGSSPSASCELYPLRNAPRRSPQRPSNQRELRRSAFRTGFQPLTDASRCCHVGVLGIGASMNLLGHYDVIQRFPCQGHCKVCSVLSPQDQGQLQK